MKNLPVVSFCVLMMLVAVSCQKKYERPDIIIGTTASTSALLTKLVLTGTDITSVYRYGYNSNSQLTTVNWNTTSGGQSIIYDWIFTRDNTGKCIQVLQKVNITGFPADGILYIAHYPTTASINFDYLTASYTLNSLPAKDSIAFAIVNGKVTQYIVYQDYANSGYQLSTKVVYTYDNSGNIITVNNYANDGTGALKLAENIVYEFDSKVNPLQLGQEAFFISGERYVSKNNFTKSVTTDYSTSTSGVTSTALYATQYNSSSKPVSAVVSDPANVNTPVTLAYTYQ